MLQENNPDAACLYNTKMNEGPVLYLIEIGNYDKSRASHQLGCFLSGCILLWTEQISMSPFVLKTQRVVDA